MLSDIYQKSEKKMQEVIERFKERTKKIRTGRASVSLLSGIVVSYYGNQSELSHIASVSCPDSRTLLISPWDQNALKSIEEALIKSSIGMAPQNDGKVIRLKVPELTEDRRKEIVRNFKKDVEKTRVELRQVRKEMNEYIRKQQKDKLINEDEQKSAEQEIQKQTDEFNCQVDEMSSQKEKELISV